MALVLPILVLLLLSIMDYGVWYSDSIAVRQGTREAARNAVVGNYTGAAGSDAAAKTADLVTQRSGTLNAAIKVQVSAQGGDNWVEGKQLTVCTMATEGGLAGFAPLPAGGQLKSKVVMRIEVAQPGGGHTSPSGDWSWC
jgi:Flp pilus assembly protein TadG